MASREAQSGNSKSAHLCNVQASTATAIGHLCQSGAPIGSVDIEAWWADRGLQRYAQAFRENEIDARSLPYLTGDDLKELGVTAIGHRRLLLQAIAALGIADQPAKPEPSVARAEPER